MFRGIGCVMDLDFGINLAVEHRLRESVVSLVRLSLSFAAETF